MKIKPKTLVIASVSAIVFFLTILAVAQTAFAQAILAGDGNCMSPVGNNYCSEGRPNPCAHVPDPCFDYFRQFSKHYQLRGRPRNDGGVRRRQQHRSNRMDGMQG